MSSHLRVGPLLFSASLFLILLFPVGTFAGDDKELTKIFDAYNILAKAGDVDKMLALRTSEMGKEIREQIKKKEDRDYLVLISRAQVPDSYEVRHITWSKSGSDADVYLLWQLPAMSEIKRSKTRMEVMVSFKKETGGWKMGNILPLGNPDQIKRPSDLSYAESDANQGVTNASVAGRIVRIEFKADHTLVMVRVMDEEIAVFLPRKDILEKAQVNLDELAPWKMRIFTGYPHKTDKLRFFATGDNPME